MSTGTPQISQRIEIISSQNNAGPAMGVIPNLLAFQQQQHHQSQHQQQLHNAISSAPQTPTSAAPSAPTAPSIYQHPEELSYIIGKWPQKVCALCNLDERSQLGQGELLRLEVLDTDRESIESSDQTKYQPDDKTQIAMLQPSQGHQRRVFNSAKSVKTNEYIDEIERIGHNESSDFSKVLDNQVYYYIHRFCAMWSAGVQREANGSLANTALAVAQSLRRKCAYCGHFGASLVCKSSGTCNKYFHLPCLAASGGFQIHNSFISFCSDHLSEVQNICSPTTDNITCRHCSNVGNISNLIICTLCGDHYHGICIGIKNSPGVRAGWQCKSCSKCQICRVADNAEGKYLTCEECNKIYHANCFRPAISSIPKFGWKCRVSGLTFFFKINCFKIILDTIFIFNLIKKL